MTDAENVVRTYYEDLCNGRRNELAAQLFTEDHVLHDPQVKTGMGPEAAAEAVAIYQEALDGHWQINELTEAGDRVVVRWTGIGTHVGELNGIAPTGRTVGVEAISIHRMRDGKICETWQVWDTLGMLMQLAVVPSAKPPALV